MSWTDKLDHSTHGLLPVGMNLWQLPPDLPGIENEAPRLVGTESFAAEVAHISTPIDAGHYVYVHLDGDNEPLYIGSTTSPMQRVANHVANKKRSPWFGDVRDIYWIRCTSAGGMRCLESTLISALAPVNNIQGNPALLGPEIEEAAA